MGKTEYLDALRRALAQMPPEELEKQIAYYDEMFSDMLEDGKSEQEICEHLGPPSAAAEELLRELPLGTLVKSRARELRTWSPLSIVLAILGAPVWLPLLLTALILIFVFVLVVWVLVFTLTIVVAACGISAVGVLIGALGGMVEGSPLLIVGVVLAAAGLCVLGSLLLPPLYRGTVKLCRAIGRGIKSLFIKKEN